MANPHTPSANDPRLPREFRERATLYAPIIRVVGHADATLEAPLVVRTPLPQFAPLGTPKSADGTEELELEAIEDDVSDADKTLERETKRKLPLAAPAPAPAEAPLPRFADGSGSSSSLDLADADATLERVTGRGDSFDTDPTLKRPAVASLIPYLPHEVDDCAPTQRRAALVAPVPAAFSPARRASSLTRQQTPFHAVTLDSSSTDVGTGDVELSADSTREVLGRLGLARRRRVQGSAQRLVAGLAAVAVVVLSLVAIHVGQDAARTERVMLETKLDLTPTRSAPATLAPKPEPVVTKVAVVPPPPPPSPEPVAVVGSSELLPVATATTAPKSTIVAAQGAKPTVKPVAPFKAKPAPVPPPKAKTKFAPQAPKPDTKAKPATKSSFGTLHTPATAKGHRVFVDGYIGGFAPQPIKLKCGKHSVRVGSAGKLQFVDVPCGGDAWAK